MVMGLWGGECHCSLSMAAHSHGQGTVSAPGYPMGPLLPSMGLSGPGSHLSYSSPPLLEIQLIYSNFLFCECATCFEVIAPSIWRSFQWMGKYRKKTEKRGECKLVSWESGKDILVSLLYLASEGCGQIYNKCIPQRSQDRVKLTRRS